MIADFHFLRPEWLWGLLAAAALFWAVSRREDLRARWGAIIAPHLLDHLIVGRRENRRLRPVHLTAAIMALGSLALAGPTWERERPPFAQDKAPLAIALDVSQSMDAIDISPTRLERAKLKIRDLLALRPGARTAIVAYAGSAHLVLPLTDDADLIETYVDSLATSLMPVAGKNSARALATAERALADEEAPGTILFITDGVEATALDAFKKHTGKDEIMALAMGTAQGGPIKAGDEFLSDSTGRRLIARLDLDALRQLKSETGAAVTVATHDDSDVQWIVRRAQTHLERGEMDSAARWNDFGWWLTIPIAMLGALWFRRGWTIRWVSAVAICLAFAPSERAKAAEWRFMDLWLTPDQQGRIAYERGDYGEAAARFADPMWRGTALYRAGRYEEALDAFARIDTAQSYFNQGDALAKQGKIEPAIKSFEKAVKRDPSFVAAKANLALLRKLLPKKTPDDEQQANESRDPEETPDSVQFDEKGKKGVVDQVEAARLTSEMWMRNIQTTPAQLLRRRFALEAERK